MKFHEKFELEKIYQICLFLRTHVYNFNMIFLSWVMNIDSNKFVFCYHNCTVNFKFSNTWLSYSKILSLICLRKKN